jgi:hypothetical protein
MRRVVVFLVLASCTAASDNGAQASDPLNVVRTDLGPLYRFENAEVVCYGRYEWGLSCSFKPQQR